jgi:hypothetical protein
MAGPTPIADALDHFLDGKLLRAVKSANYGDDSSREPVIPSGARAAEGSVFKPGAETITLECWAQTVPEVDWHDKKRKGTISSYVGQYRAGATKGQRIQASVQVQKVNRPQGENGELMYTVELLVIGNSQTI